METVLWIMAIAGTAMFVLKTALLLLGADHGADSDSGGMDIGHVDAGHTDAGGVDADHGGDHPGDHGPGSHTSDAAFTLLSVQSLSTLCMGTGWMGLSGLRSFGLNEIQALVVGLAFGLLLVLLMGKLLQKVRRLESSGTLIIQGAVGLSGTVYATVPEKGRGQIQIVLQGRLATLDATTRGSTIPTGKKVRVDAVDGTGALVVSVL